MKAFGLSFKKSEHSLYVSDDRSAVPYSDGEAEETKLAAIIAATKNLSAISWELQHKIQSWTQRYHLTMHRGAIVRCLSFLPGAHVLEMGAGCGAVTRALGEQFSRVDAVEGSIFRAHLCASRCRDLPNVQVFAADINQLVPQPTYDIVLLIGVLEWSKGYIHEPDAFHECLRVATRALNENGILVLAIENQLGLKYFLGLGEDHCGKPLEGIQGYPTFHQAATFSKVKLCGLLDEVGLRERRFLYPFPDYKMARVVATDEAVSLQSESIGYWVSRYAYEDYLNPTRTIRGHQGLITSEVTKAGLLGELSNSLLVLAAARDFSLPPLPWLVWSERLTPCELYRSQTTLEHAGNGLIVKKIRPRGLSDSTDTTPFRINASSQEPFWDGSVLELDLVRHAMSGSKDKFFHAIQIWMAYVHSNWSKNDGIHLRAEAWDCIPRNLIHVHGSGLRAIDLEFICDGLFAKGELCARGLLWWYLEHFAWAAPLNPAGRSVREQLEWALSELPFVSDATTLIDRTIEREEAFQSFLGFSNAGGLRQKLNERRYGSQTDPQQRLAEVEMDLQNTKSQLNRLRNHPVLGRVIFFWRNYINPNLP